MNFLLSLLATVSISAQDLGKSVSAEVRASSAPAAIAELAKQVGYPLEAMPSTKDDIIIIKVTDVPLKVLLEKIATATNTEWEQTAQGMRLIRTDPIRRKETSEEYARLVQEIQSSLDKTRKLTQEEGEFTERMAQATADRLVNMNANRQAGQPITDWREQQQLSNLAPIQRLTRKISLLFDAKTLASIPEGKRIVMSNQPNRMQLPLPGNIQPHVQAFVKEQAVWAKAMKVAKNRRGGQQVYYYNENATDPMNRKVGKIILSLSRHSESRGVQATLTISDERGRMLGSASQSVGWDSDAFYTQVQEAGKSASPEPSMQFSGPSVAMIDAYKAMYRSAMAGGGDANPVDTSPEVRELLIHPEKYEPLSILATDCIFEVARIRGLDIVCSAPDAMVFSAGVDPSGDIKPTGFLARLRSMMQVETKDGWMILKPVIPSASRKARLDRALFAQFIGQTIKDGRVTLDNRASFAFRSELEQESYLPMFTLTMAGLIDRNGEHGGDWDSLRLYGSLTAAQRQAAERRQPIPFRALQPAQMEILHRMVFDSPWSRLQVSYQQEDFADLQDDEGIMYGGGLHSEPTEVLPNGFTGTEILNISETRTARLFGRPDTDGQTQVFYGESAYDVNSLAQMMFQEERPELFPWMNQPGYPRGKVTKVRSGTQRQVTIQAQFTRRASLHIQLTDKTYSGEAVAIDKLPADIRKQIQEALVRLREQYKDAKPPTWDYGGGGGNTPPPPAPTR